MTKMVSINLSTISDAQEFVNILGAHEGSFKLRYNTGIKDITVDAKSILGVVTIISPKFLTLETPADFSFDTIRKFIK